MSRSATVDEALDAHIERARQRFEQSLIDNAAPPEQLDTLLAWHDATMREWHKATLDRVRAALLHSHETRCRQAG